MNEDIVGNIEGPIAQVIVTQGRSDPRSREAGLHPFAVALLIAASVLVLCSATSLLTKTGSNINDFLVLISQTFARRQDIPVALASSAVYLWFYVGRRSVGRSLDGRQFQNWQLVLLLIAASVCAWILRSAVLFDFDLSRDEHMVAFDSAIFAEGRLFYPLSPSWQPYYKALNDLFLLPVGDHDGWVSSYLPMNAALRAFLGLVMPGSFVSPLLVFIGGLALWRISCRLWPESASTRSVVLLLFVGSSQVLLMGTTTYAMTAHMTFNLLWLWLFLQRRPVAQAGAITIGFLATGLHQPVFHPLFVAPFFELLRRERRWKELVIYLSSYAGIGLFWLAWPHWISSLEPLPPTPDGETIDLLDRMKRSLTVFNENSVWMMSANLLRFFVWQHLLLLPLAIVGLFSWRKEPPVGALALGIAFLLGAMLILMPVQAWGFGYRYLHGFIGSAILLAGYGWHALEKRHQAPVAAWRIATGLSLFVLLPLHAAMARQFVAPFAAASARIRATPADVVVLDDGVAPFAPDLAFNLPDLSNRPILFRASGVDPDTLQVLCRDHSLSFADASRFGGIFATLSVDPKAARPSSMQMRLHAQAAAAGCRIVQERP